MASVIIRMCELCTCLYTEEDAIYNTLLLVAGARVGVGEGGSGERAEKVDRRVKEGLLTHFFLASFLPLQ